METNVSILGFRLLNETETDCYITGLKYNEDSVSFSFGDLKCSLTKLSDIYPVVGQHHYRFIVEVNRHGTFNILVSRDFYWFDIRSIEIKGFENNQDHINKILFCLFKRIRNEIGTKPNGNISPDLFWLYELTESSKEEYEMWKQKIIGNFKQSARHVYITHNTRGNIKVSMSSQWDLYVVVIHWPEGQMYTHEISTEEMERLWNSDLSDLNEVEFLTVAAYKSIYLNNLTPSH